jgi:drug/metabolite transporter (DMT)-like permease
VAISVRIRFCWGYCVPGGGWSYGISYVYMDRYLARQGINPVTLSACQLLAAALGGARAPAPRPDATVVVSIAILGILGTGVAYVLNYQIITREGATIASTVTYLLPVVAIVLGVAVLDERVTLPVIGIALILLGVALTRRRKQKHLPGKDNPSDKPASPDHK